MAKASMAVGHVEEIFGLQATAPEAILNQCWGDAKMKEVESFRLHPSCTRAGAVEGKAHLHGRWMNLSTQLTSVLSEGKMRRTSNRVIEGSRSLSLGARMREHWLEKPFEPEGSFRICWDSLALVLVMLDGFLTPIAIAWELPIETNPVFYVSFLISFGFWFADILLNFNTAVSRLILSNSVSPCVV